MYCCDTPPDGIPVIKIDQLIHVPELTIDEAVDIGSVLRVVRGIDHGNGEICIPLVNGLFEQIRVSVVKYRDKVTKKRKKTGQ